MKRSVFIIAGIIFIFVLIALWVYVLFYGTPKNVDGIFSDFGFPDTTDTSITEVAVVTEEEQPTVDVSGPNQLRQLTTAAVIGYQEVQATPSSTPAIYYTEAGTGHVFSINSISGEETKISGTTIPGSSQAAITPNGKYVMVQSGNGTSLATTLGTVSSTSAGLTLTTLDESIVSFKANQGNTFFYTTKTSNALEGKVYDPSTRTSKKLFSVPFQEAVVQWGRDEYSNHYIYPKAANQLYGFVYVAQSGVLNRLPIDGFGLSALGNDDYVLSSASENGAYTTSLYLAATSTLISFHQTLIPEKCAFSQNIYTFLFCGVTENTDTTNLPDSWYQGTGEYADGLWMIDTQAQSSTYLVNTLADSGRAIDIINLTVSPSNSVVYFMNKQDKTLWLYELLIK